MRIEEGPLDGLLVVLPEAFADERGFFLEAFRRGEYAAGGIDLDFVQINHSRSARGTIRGLHFQRGRGQAKLVAVPRGRILDVAVDIRRGSRTFGRHAAIELDDRSHRQLFIPSGFAHGFCVLSSVADVVYLVDRYYDHEAEAGIAFDDPELSIGWPVRRPIVSARDRANPSLQECVGPVSRPPGDAPP